MKQIRIRYFAAFREATGIETEQVNSEAGTPAALFAECSDRFDRLHKYASAMVALNDEMSDWETPLQDGDEVLFFPPVAGG